MKHLLTLMVLASLATCAFGDVFKATELLSKALEEEEWVPQAYAKTPYFTSGDQEVSYPTPQWCLGITLIRTVRLPSTSSTEWVAEDRDFSVGVIVDIFEDPPGVMYSAPFSNSWEFTDPNIITPGSVLFFP